MGCRNDKRRLLVTSVLLMARRNYCSKMVIDLSGDKSDTVSYCPPGADTVTYLDTVVYPDTVPFVDTVVFMDIVPYRHTVPFVDTVPFMDTVV